MSEIRASGFWSGETLKNSDHIVYPFNRDSVDANAYNLRMGNSYFRTADSEGSEPQKKVQLSPGESFLIPSGQFAFLSTLEEVRIPAHAMAFISMRTRLKFQGLINVSGFHVDPGYRGRLIFSVYNVSPTAIHLCQGDKIFKMWLDSLDTTSSGENTYSGTPQSDITNEMVRGMSRGIYSLQSLADKMRVQEATVDKQLAEQRAVIDQLVWIWRALLIGVVVSLIGSGLILAWAWLPHVVNLVGGLLFPGSAPIVAAPAGA